MTDRTQIIAEVVARTEARLFSEGRNFPVLPDFEVMIPEITERTGLSEADARRELMRFCGGAAA